MRKTLLAAAAALLFLLPVASGHAAPLGPFDPPERDEFRFRWGEGISTRYDDYFSNFPNRTVWQNQAYVYGEYSGYDWSASLRGGAATFTSSGLSELDPIPFFGGAAKALVWSDTEGVWTVGATVTFDQAFPFETAGSRPTRISGLYNASAGFGFQKRLDDRRIAYGGPVYSLGGFSVSPQYLIALDNGDRIQAPGSYYKLENHVGLHGGMKWTLPGIDLQAEGGLTLGGLSAAVSFRLPLEGGPASLFPRSIRELFEGKSERPREEKDGWRQGPVRDDGPAEIPGEGEGER